MNLLTHKFLLCLVSLACLSLLSCSEQEEEAVLGLRSEQFYERYNKYILEWLSEQKRTAEQTLEERKEELATTSDEEARKRIEGSIAELEREIAKLAFRQELGDFFAHKDIGELPENLVWENGEDQPDIGDPAATKGGVFNYFMPTFPPTVRQIGSNSNNGVRGDLYDLIEVYLVHLHPVTQEIIPGVAKEWAVGPDNRTVYFRIHPDAKFNDGHPIEAEDFLTWARMRLSDHVESIFFKQVIREQFAQLAVYDDDLLAITLPEEKPLIAYECGSIPPSASHFYDEFGPDYEERFQWIVPPTTAAYTVYPDDIVKGESITLSRVDDWWLRDRKFYRYRYNADKIVYRVVRDSSKAWELFRAGKIDYFSVTLPEYYYDRSEIPAVFDGYIERTTWYNQYPRIPWGLYLNTAEKPLDNKMVRRGIAYATNWQKVIDVVFRGDFARLQGFTSGYSVTNPDIMARPFSIDAARKAFAEAGYDREDNDGILMNQDGQRLDVELTFVSVPERTRIMVILKEEARRAGLNLILDGREPTASYKKLVSKEHQIAFSAWSFTPPFPAYYEYFHSRNAFDEKGNRKTQTNNVFSYADERMDVLTEAYRNARTFEELNQAAQEIQAIVAEEDLFIPGYTNEFVRVANWRWVRWPDVPETRFAPPLAYSPLESYCYWIDTAAKKKTLAAMRKKETFPEVERVVEDYRSKVEREEAAPTGEELSPNVELDPAPAQIEEANASEPTVEGGQE